MNIFQPKFSVAILLLMPSFALSHNLHNGVNIYPPAIQSGLSQVPFISGVAAVDGPRVQVINESVWQWWYFDAVSSDGKSNFVISFFTISNLAFPFGGANLSSCVSVSISGTFSNGTSFATGYLASEAVVITVHDGSSGTWHGLVPLTDGPLGASEASAAWKGTPDMSVYTVTIDAPAAAIKGSLNLRSIAPAHYPCGPPGPNQTLQILPHVGWTNAVPDASATANFSIAGSALTFSGPGYHDLAWSDTPFLDSVGGWYWGHGRLGNYSLVWWDARSAAGVEYVSHYVACEGRIVSAACAGLKVRPTGANDTYPPTLSSGVPRGFSVEMDLGGMGVLEVSLTAGLVTPDVPGFYARWTGVMEGGIKGGEMLVGVALMEEFTV